MKTDLSKIDTNVFFINEGTLNSKNYTALDIDFPSGQQKFYLVNPKRVGVEWTNENKWLRSSIWTKDGELVSVGYPKFPNWGENPVNFPVPESLDNCTFIEKMDGSLLIVSKYKGRIILRTRGTFDARNLANGHEMDIFERDILPAIDDDQKYNHTWDVSYLFEWISPENVIVVGTKETKFVLIGAVGHQEGKLATQSDLDSFAKYYELNRPKTYTFPKDILSKDLLKIVEEWQGVEGMVIYSNDGQSMHKLKSLWYLHLHRAKSDLCNFDKVFDVWFDQGMSSKEDFHEWATTNYDFELAETTSPFIERMVELKKLAEEKVADIKLFVDANRHWSKKDFAMSVLSQFKESGMSSFYFNVYDNKEIVGELFKKLMVKIQENNP